MVDRLTNRWTGVTGLAYASAAIGILVGRPSALILCIVGVAYAAYSQDKAPPRPSLDFQRTIAEDEPDPGEEVVVRLTLQNAGDEVIPDVRIVDGVPPALGVVEGSPRLGTSLQPGETDHIEYLVHAQRGEHEFGDITVISRNWSGAAECEEHQYVESTIRCIPELGGSVGSFPLRGQTIRHAGRVTTDTGGSGIEFHSTREYRSGDPFHRIDWSRTAKTGEFTTIQFREEQAATVAIVIDTRRDAYVVDADGQSAVEHCIRAAGEIAPALMSDGDNVGVASFGPVWTFLSPGLGRTQRAKLREILAVGEGFTSRPHDERYLPRHTVRQLRKNLPGDSQVIFCSPVADDYLVTTLRRIEAYGHAVTVVSPDVTDADSPGGRVASMERQERLRTIRAAGIRAVDWDPEKPLALSVNDAKRRWSK
ncbi:MAG: DUF58 domain-containing protein [Halobacteriaceae archaeon]